ncbi:hypothetical protein C8J56DRAFT_1000773 [Mycena floridula]|nr:hypothetical protein C8J56DRAFT_1000773 [Mycena floridula]
MSLALDEYRHTQMILDGFGLPGQLKLKKASVAVVGARGLGYPALQYLGAAGVGRIGIVHHDTVGLPIYRDRFCTTRKHCPKAQALNSHLVIDLVSEALLPQNAVQLLGPYDIILDFTDKAPTRYLLSDTAVALGKPLISRRYNHDGPCYRSQETVDTCEETRILGAVTGAIKVTTGLRNEKLSLLLNIKMRSRKPTCPACGIEGQRIGEIQSVDYVQFCGGSRPDWGSGALQEHYRRTLNVQPSTEFGICSLENSINIPLNRFVAQPSEYLPPDTATHTYLVCPLVSKDVISSLRAWSKRIDPVFPV